tara:strand:+ start:1276 stop:3975 length:2700 start_codon:yes stop_codon:yes gene_type:complete
MLFGKKDTVSLMEEEAIAPKYAWHAHAVEEVLAVLGVREEGLSHEEVLARRAASGLNVFTKPKHRSLITKFAEELKAPLSVVLLFALAITAALEEFVDASVIGLVLLLAIAISIFQEGKASRAFEKLSESETHIITVFRDGARHQVAIEELVEGDIVELQAGVQVPADVRLVDTNNLTLNESPLTGEWVPVKKSTTPLSVGVHLTDRVNMAYKGTFVADGYGVGVVVAIGDQTEMGALAKSLTEIEDVKTPIQHEMTKVSQVIIYIILALVSLTVVLGIINGQSVHDVALLAVAVAVASIPEGLPAAVSIILAVGMEAILRKNGLVRNLLAAETLGSTTYVLTDKTGTLTVGNMAVTGVIHGGLIESDEKAWHENQTIVDLFDMALCATDSYVDEVNGRRVLRGDGVEKAILEVAIDIGLTKREDSLKETRVDYLPFTSEKRFAAGLSPVGNKYRLCINGAPEFILEKADKVIGESGEKVLLEEERESLLEAITTETSNGKRLIAIAYKEVQESSIEDIGEESLLEELVFAGVLILNDPVRKSVKKSIAGVLEAGAKIVLVTGDNPQTALYIAKHVGIAGPHETVLTGRDLESMSDSEIMNALLHIHVFARVLPKQKMRLTEILQRHGEIVAMTGDGINDAPALRKANIGVAIGSGTEVAKAASDLILMKDSFNTIYYAIEEGRRIIDNLRKIIGYLLATSLTEVALIVSALVAGMAAPLLPVQILWANIVEEGLMGIAFAFEKGEKGAMKRPPRDVHEEGVLSKTMLSFLALVIVVLSAITVSLYFYLISLGMPLDELRSAMFLSISIDSLFIAFAFRTLHSPVWRTPFLANRFFFISLALSFIALFGALAIPFMRDLLSYTPLPAFVIALIFAFAGIGFMMVEFCKMHFFSTHHSPA